MNLAKNANLHIKFLYVLKNSFIDCPIKMTHGTFLLKTHCHNGGVLGCTVSIASRAMGVLKNVISRLVGYKTYTTWLDKQTRVSLLSRSFMLFPARGVVVATRNTSRRRRQRPKNVLYYWQTRVLIPLQNRRPFLYLRELAINCAKSVVKARAVAYTLIHVQSVFAPFQPVSFTACRGFAST